MSRSPVSRSVVPVFDLYGDPARDPVLGFLHAERIRTRAPLHGWTIGPHRHADLSQAFLVTRGGGTVAFEDRNEPFRAPWAFWIPEATVHGFRFEPDTDGHVVTVAADFLDEAFARGAAAELRPFRTALVSIAVAPPEAERLAADFEAIQAEIAGADLAGRAAIAARLDLILVGLARIRAPLARPAAEDRHTALFRRFRALVEERFRRHEPVPAYAARLGVTADRLHDAVVRVAGRPPQAVLHERLVLEAKRALVYTGMTVAEIGFDLGFRDPAYFSRFFALRTGRPPAAFRRDPDGAGR